jgi:osmoprotectant transport system ATP-binding protein
MFINHVSHSYLGQRNDQSLFVLKNFSYHFTPQKTYAILGQSGSGKSTLVNILAGLIRPTFGEVECASHYGYVQQQDHLFEHLNLFDNISIQGLQNKESVFSRQKRVFELCDLVKIPRDWLKRSPSQLSGGQKKRVALIRSLYQDPSTLFLDEAFTGLDPLLKYELVNELKNLFQELNKTVVIVTHDLIVAKILSQFVLLLKEGEMDCGCESEIFFRSPPTPFSQAFIQAQDIQR